MEVTYVNGDPYATSTHHPTGNKEKTLQEEQTDPLDFSCGAGSNSEQLIPPGYDHSASTNKANVHPYAFGRPLHAEYITSERSFYYRDSLGTVLHYS